MEPVQKSRINLYIEQQLLDFGKRYSHVMGQSLSSLIENFLRHENEKTKIFSAEQFLSYKEEQEVEWYHVSGKFVKDQENSIEEFLNDKEEIEYCKINPESIRAKLRIQLIKEQEERNRSMHEQMEVYNRRREKERQEFIQRWNETFK